MNVRVSAVVARAGRIAGVVLPRGRTSLVRCFAEDALLRWCTLALFLAACVPLLLTPFLPFADMGINTAAATLMWDAAFGNQPVASHFEVVWEPIPYWTTYLFTTVTARIFGPLAAAKLLTAVVFALIPLGIMRLLLALRRDPRLGLCAFALVWDHNLYAGWLAFLASVGLASFVLAWLIEAESVRDAGRLVPYTALLALTHAQGVILVGVAGVLLAFTTSRLVLRDAESPPLRRRLAVHAVALSGLALMGLPWVLARFEGAGGAGAAFSFEWHTPSFKLSKVFGYTLDNFSRPDAERLAAITFVAAVVGPLLLSLLPRREEAAKHHASAVVMVLGAGALYALLPMTINGPIAHWYTYPRYATVTLLWLLLLPAPRLGAWAASAVLPGVLLALTMDVKVARQFRGFAERTRPLQQVIAHVRPKASMLAMVFDDWDPDPDVKLPPYHQMHAYITATKRGFDPYLWGTRAAPLVYRDAARLPSPGWQGTFTMDAHGQYYDYLLVQAFHKADPAATAVSSSGLRPRLVVEAGRWRLYEVRGAKSRGKS